MLQILDENFQILQTVPHVKSIQWTTRFTEAGSFRLQLPQGFQSEVELMGKLIRYKEHYGIIQYITADEEQLEIRGYDLKVITIFRQAIPGTYTGAAETVIKRIVEDNTQGERAFPNFTIAADQKRGDTITYTIDKADSMENVLKKLCEEHGIGYEISAQNQSICFDVVIPKTVDHTYSERRRNVTGWEYTHDQLTEKNTELLWCKPMELSINTREGVYIWITFTGQFVLGDKIYTMDHTVTDAISMGKDDKWECYVLKSETDARGYKFGNSKSPGSLGQLIAKGKGTDKSLATVCYTFSGLNAGAEQTAAAGFLRKETGMEIAESELPSDKIMEDLSGKVESETISADILSPEDYRTVWSLGDFVKIKISLFGQSLTVSRQITEIDEVYEPNNIKLTPVFGRQKDNIIRKLQKGRM